MDTTGWILISILCLAVGFLAAYFLLNRKLTEQKIENINLKQRTELDSQRISSLTEERNALSAKLEESNSKLNKAMSDYAAESEKTKWIHDADKNMREAFSSISREIMNGNNAAFINSANDKLNDFSQKLDEKMLGEKRAVESIMLPVSEQLKELQKNVSELEVKRTTDYNSVTTMINDFKTLNESLKNETSSLNSALRNSSVRGKWGEEQLRRIAELAGLVEHIDFEEQQVSDDGKRPDMIITLTGNRIIPVDSKVPMDDYLQYAEATDAAQRHAYVLRHVSAVKKHIDALSKKEYWKMYERSIPFVVMVMPYESGLSSAFEADNEILRYGLTKNVLLLSPMTFYSFLKSVSMGWTEYNMAENAKEIAKLSAELIDRFEKFFSYMGDVGLNMNKAVSKYNEAIGSYNKRLLPTFKKLKTLNSKPETEALDPVESVLVISEETRAE